MKNIFESMEPESSKRFKAELNKIQEKHIEWFNSDDNTRGDIHKHCTVIYGFQNTPSQGVFFTFEPESNLPPGIRDECSALYKEIFLA